MSSGSFSGTTPPKPALYINWKGKRPMAMALSILAISLLIVVHEFGHYLVARVFGMRVLRFSVGFGPALLQRKIGPTIWQIAAIPLGGFVQIHGMGPSEADASDSTPTDPNGHNDPAAAPAPPDPESFRSKPVWQRFLVILAGPATNWLTAAVLIAIMGFAMGFERPDFTIAGIGTVQPESPADAAGLQSGDRILMVQDDSVNDWDSLVRAIENNPEIAVTMIVSRNGVVQAKSVTPGKHPQSGKGYLGITPSTVVESIGFGASMSAGVRGAWSFTQQQAGLLWGMLRGKQEGQLSGLPGIVRAMSNQAEESMRRFFHTLAWLSIGLFLLNLLPIPALDGSRLLFLTIEAVQGRPVNEKAEGMAHGIGFVLLFALMIFVSVRDLM